MAGGEGPGLPVPRRVARRLRRLYGRAARAAAAWGPLAAQAARALRLAAAARARLPALAAPGPPSPSPSAVARAEEEAEAEEEEAGAGRGERLRGEQLRSLGRTLEALEAALGGLRAQVRELERAAKEARDVRRAEYPGVAAADLPGAGGGVPALAEYLGGLEALAEAHRDELRVKQALAAGLWACPEGAGAEVDELVALFAAGPCVDEREVQFLLDRGLAEPDRDG